MDGKAITWPDMPRQREIDAAYERAAEEVERIGEEFCRAEQWPRRSGLAMNVDAMAAAIRALKGTG